SVGSRTTDPLRPFLSNLPPKTSVSFETSSGASSFADLLRGRTLGRATDLGCYEVETDAFRSECKSNHRPAPATQKPARRGDWCRPGNARDPLSPRTYHRLDL